jgi:dihydropteroate synthase
MSFQVVGILNITPDSFFDGSHYLRLNKAYEHALKLIEEGADMLDVGGESTRPGSKPVSLEEEKKRVLPLIKKLAKEVNVLISIDTTKASLAYEAVHEGASVINDISGFTMDPEMVSTVAKTKATVILGHIQGAPQNMQVSPRYENVVDDVNIYFKRQLGLAQNAGVAKSKIILDPGIGFGKTLEHNLEVLNHMDEFLQHECPLMVGVSRKSFIGKIQNDNGPQDRLAGSLAAAVLCYQKGVKYFRVHDVKETKQALSVTKEILRYGELYFRS